MSEYTLQRSEMYIIAGMKCCILYGRLQRIQRHPWQLCMHVGGEGRQIILFFFFELILFICVFICFTLQYCICFAIHWHESTMGIHVFPFLCTPPTSLTIPPLRVIPVHQPRAPCIMHWPGLVTRFTYDNMHVSMPFSQIISPSPSPTVSKRLFYTSVSLLLSYIQGYHYHLSKFHIYALLYCIGVFLSGLLHSV